MSAASEELIAGKWRRSDVKATIRLSGLIMFLLMNFYTILPTLKFIWACYFVRRHNTPISADVAHTDFAIVTAGNTIAWAMIVAVIVHVACRVVDLIWPRMGPDEAELDVRRRATLKRCKLIQRETKSLESAEKLLENNAALRSALSKLQDELIKIRLEADKIQTRKTASRNSARPAEVTDDLFNQKPHEPTPQPRLRPFHKKMANRAKSAPRL